MQKYYHLVKQLLEYFEQKELVHVDRGQNNRVYALAYLASTKILGQHRTLIQETSPPPPPTLLRSAQVELLAMDECLSMPCPRR